MAFLLLVCQLLGIAGDKYRQPQINRVIRSQTGLVFIRLVKFVFLQQLIPISNILFYYIHFEVNGVCCDLIGSQVSDLARIAPLAV